jgi:hypothetical protein
MTKICLSWDIIHPFDLSSISNVLSTLTPSRFKCKTKNTKIFQLSSYFPFNILFKVLKSTSQLLRHMYDYDSQYSPHSSSLFLYFLGSQPIQDFIKSPVQESKNYTAFVSNLRVWDPINIYLNQIYNKEINSNDSFRL